MKTTPTLRTDSYYVLHTELLEAMWDQQMHHRVIREHQSKARDGLQALRGAYQQALTSQKHMAALIEKIQTYPEWGQGVGVQAISEEAQELSRTLRDVCDINKAIDGQLTQMEADDLAEPEEDTTDAYDPQLAAAEEYYQDAYFFGQVPLAEYVTWLASQGHSTKIIAEVVGKSRRTVQRVLKEAR